MNTMVWLECNIKSDINSDAVTISVLLQDGTTTEVVVPPNVLIEKDGKYFVYVESMGSKNNLVYVRLPEPSILHGRLMTVKQQSISQHIKNGNSIAEVLSGKKIKRSSKKI